MPVPENKPGDRAVGRELCETLFEVLSGENLVLFAGAGVGVHAGLPDWRGFATHLASVARKYEPDTAAIMEARISAGRLADAVSYYKLCHLIPEGEKFAELARPFDDEGSRPEALEQLVKLPFEAVVTPNYDRCIDNAWAAVHHKAPLAFELDDGSLRQAGFTSGFYIARIHGRALRPESMVASTEDFAKLDRDDCYTDFLTGTVLTRRCCLFLGFSFEDPAIRKILDILKRRVGPSFPRRHYALLPEGAVGLAAELPQFNIHVITYPAPDALWDCIESMPLRFAGAPKPPPARTTGGPLPYEQMRLFLANCYVQSKVSHVAGPLRDLVLLGIVLSLVEQNQSAVTVPQIGELLRQVVPLDRQRAEHVAARAVDSLVGRGWVSSSEGAVRMKRAPSKVLEDSIETLVRGTLSRLLVREGADAKSAYADSVRTVLQEVVFARGWDLGAEFAGAKTAGTVDLYQLIKGAFRDALPAESFDKHARLANALYHLLRRPDVVEARILAEVARLSFGLNVILKIGSAALRSDALPGRIYFDASILLPAITDGHPLRPVYQSTINKIRTAAGETGRECALLVIPDFLNEVVSHRRRAIEMVRDLGLEDPERLERHVLYYGAENTNVFVGAYASWVGRQKNAVSFNDFLEASAPYASEESLSRFIGRLGIRTVRVPEADNRYREIYRDFEGALGSAYGEFEAVGWGRDKAEVLVRHEALQLALVELEVGEGLGTYFVTADKSLRSIVTTIRLGRAWNVVISHLGLVQLTDLLLGVEADPRSLARLMWGVVEVDGHAAVRDYFVDLALRKYDEALVMALPEIMEDLVSEAEKAARLEGVDFFGKRTEDRAKAARFLDRFEARFFENMAEAVRKRKAQEGGS